MVVTLREIAEKRNITYRAVKKRRDTEEWPSEGKRLVNHKEAEVFHINSLPEDLRGLFSSCCQHELGLEAEIYSRAPEWARRKADKYLSVLRATEGLRGSALMQFIAEWNMKHPDFKASYPRVLEARKAYMEQGISGLLAGYGRSAGKSIISDEWFRYFKAAYLVEGAPSLRSCWLRTLGYAKELDSDITVSVFPSPITFLRRLERGVPRDAIFMARHGREAWNRKYGTYIDRDYTNLRPGECLVSDHAQVDVAVLLPSGKVSFPWITAWRDFKSGKWLGWLHHTEAPNSDHVFQSFYHSVRKYGLPTDVYIDNGKDYRCRDFAGGRKSHRVSVNDSKAVSMLGLLDITPRFSLPRNAQAKAIERDFLRNKEWFSKHMPGYRGGHVKERPEKLNSEIKSGKILTWDEYQTLMDSFISDVLNRMPVNGKVHKGMCPDELWDREHREARMASTDALKLFCMRTSKALTIGRNGIRDGEMGVTYWGEWMSGMKGRKAYLRRDIKEYQEAWVFSASDDEYLGKAYIAERAAALARTPVEKAQLKALLTDKRLMESATKAYIRVKDAPSPSEALSHMKAGVRLLNGDYEPDSDAQIIKLSNTDMDKAIRMDRRMKREGTYDLGSIKPPEKEGKPIYLYETDMEMGMERGNKDD